MAPTRRETGEKKQQEEKTGNKVSNNYLKVKEDAWSTTKRCARPRSSWIKFRVNAIVFHGLL